MFLDPGLVLFFMYLFILVVFTLAFLFFTFFVVKFKIVDFMHFMEYDVLQHECETHFHRGS